MLAAKQPWLAVFIALGSFLFGDAIEARITAHCPACGVALQIARAIAA
jgi:hypothetical protein